MALASEKKRRMAQALIKAVHECDAGMKQGVIYYRNAQSPAEALELLKRAARLPYRIEARAQALVAKYGAANVNAALATVSTLTLADLQAELDPLKAYSDTLKNHYQIGGWTKEQIAADIEANRADIDQDESAPIPGGYVDDF
jgi:hypothetical protein